MMGQQTRIQPKIFYPHMNLEQRVPRTHLLRRIQEQIDFNFIYAEVRDSYGSNGNISIPPPVILKMMSLLVLYNVRSERELMETIPIRLDWLWFLGYDIEGPRENRVLYLQLKCCIDRKSDPPRITGETVEKPCS